MLTECLCVMKYRPDYGLFILLPPIKAIAGAFGVCLVVYWFRPRSILFWSMTVVLLSLSILLDVAFLSWAMP